MDSCNSKHSRPLPQNDCEILINNHLQHDQILAQLSKNATIRFCGGRISIDFLLQPVPFLEQQLCRELGWQDLVEVGVAPGIWLGVVLDSSW